MYYLNNARDPRAESRSAIDIRGLSIQPDFSGFLNNLLQLV